MPPIVEHGVAIPARDGYDLGGTVLTPEGPKARGTVIVSGATAVPHRFYRRFASAIADSGYTVVTYDYRGIAASRRGSLRGFDADMTDWVFSDMAGVVDWASEAYPTDRMFLAGHSFGGQAAGLLDNVDRVRGMVTFSAQSGYWRLQGGEQQWIVGFHVHATLPAVSTVFGYTPWSTFGAGEDLPKGVATQWARWCRNPDYLFGDSSLPLERYDRFPAPVLAYSFDDDKWGTAEAVDDLMLRYPDVERRHVVPADEDLDAIGHMGFFRESSATLWPDVITWLDAH